MSISTMSYANESKEATRMAYSARTSAAVEMKSNFFSNLFSALTK